MAHTRTQHRTLHPALCTPLPFPSNVTAHMSTPIGFIGLGLMGRPMALNLRKHNFDVIVHSRSRGPVDALVAAGARAADSPAAVARHARTIITMLPDGPDVSAVLEGEHGVFSALQPGTIIVDSSTIAPATARRWRSSPTGANRSPATHQCGPSCWW